MQPAGGRTLHARTPSLGDSLVSLDALAERLPAAGGPPGGGASGGGAPGGGGGRGSGAHHARTPSDGAAQRRRQAPAALSRTRRTLELALVSSLFLWLAVIFYSSHGRWDVSRAGGAASSASAAAALAADGRAACGDAPGAPAAGRFLLPRASYAPPHGPSRAGLFAPSATAASSRYPRVFVLTAVAADAPASPALLSHFVSHYAALGVPPAQLLVLAQAEHEESAGLVALGSLLASKGVFLDVWLGPLPPFSALARRWRALLSHAAARADWLLLLDADEVLRLPHGQSLPSLAAAAGALGYDALQARRVEMTAAPEPRQQRRARATLQDLLLGGDNDAPSNGSAATPPPEVPAAGADGALRLAFPRRCGVGGSCEGAPPPGPFVLAAAGAGALERLRALDDVGVDDRPAGAAGAGFAAVYPVPLTLEHYGWHADAAAALDARAAALTACGAGSPAPSSAAARAAAAGAAAGRLAAALRASHGRLTPSACPSLRCAAPPQGGRTITPPAGTRRVAVVTSVWEHVDGVSKTLQTVIRHLLAPARAADPAGGTAVMLLTPDVGGGGLRSQPLAEAAAAAAAAIPGLAVVPIPSLPAPGRPDYRWAPPLTPGAAAELALFRPDAIHTAAPDFLGHSAVAWAASHGVCSLCTYHTAFPTYLQYYGVGIAEPAVSAFMARFYRGCDAVAVPTWAAADALAAAGVPRSKMAFFPRGVNATLYRPQARSATWRAAVVPGAAPDEVLILWVARIVREKGLDTFVRALRLLHATALAAEGTAEALPPFRVLIAGTGPDLPWLRAALPAPDDAKYDAADTPRVVYLGHAGGGALATTLASCDVFFFPSRTEVFPNNVAEAMASGLAVVAEDVGVVRALVRHNVTGLLVPPAPRARGGDASAHAAALAALLRDAPARARLGAAAARSTQGLTWRRAVGALTRGYDACAARKRAAAAKAAAAKRGAAAAAAAASPAASPAAAVAEFIWDSGAEADALIYAIGTNLTGRYQHTRAAAGRDADAA